MRRNNRSFINKLFYFALLPIHEIYMKFNLNRCTLALFANACDNLLLLKYQCFLTIGLVSLAIFNAYTPLYITYYSFIQFRYTNQDEFSVSHHVMRVFS